MKLNKVFINIFICIALISCNKETTAIEPPVSEQKLELTYSTPPIKVPPGTKFAKDISYGSDQNSKFDIFIPTSSNLTALVVFIHGGGFVGGDKSEIYSQHPDDIRFYLQNNIAFASINYKFRTVGSQEGIMVSLNDIKRCIQFMRYYAKSLNIDKPKIACFGSSAGGGASIYLAFHPDMADPSNSDSISRESTRIKAAGHLTSQCSYDPIVMTDIFNSAGIDILSIPKLEESLMADYGINSFDLFYSDPNIIATRNELNLLGWMTADDPEFFVGNSKPNNTPTTRSEAIHHPLHAKALVDKATSIGLAHIANIPHMNIFPANNETIRAFMIRKLSE
jgi:hypothetical protein